MMSTIHDRRNQKRLIATKGAPEILIQRCTRIQRDDSISVMTSALKEQIMAASDAMAGRALRVLALAWRETGFSESNVEGFDSDHIETDLIFCGLVGMMDPPRDEVQMSVKECLKAGIRPVMVTGDHKMTAQAIARMVGILDHDMDEGSLNDFVKTGEELEKMRDQDIDRIIRKVKVFSRVSPEHKIRIVEAYQRKGDVVAMTGDGVNDAPALKRADIGVAMGIKGTDVSREAADMVLADDNFATIVAAVEEGRAAFENIKKYLIFLLSCNLGEILILTGAFFFGLPIPLIALQILWVNLTTDGLPALALGVDPPDPDLMDHPPRGKNSTLFTPWLMGLISFISVHMFLILFIIFNLYLRNALLIKAQTMVFISMILLEMFNAFNCRSEKYSVTKRLPWQNPWLIAGVAASVAMSIMVIHIPFMNVLFHTQPLEWRDWMLAASFASTILLVVEFVKWVRKMWLKSVES